MPNNQEKAALPKTVFKPAALFRRIINNPNLNYQLLVIMITLFSDNMQMDRKINGMNTTIDKIRNLSQILDGAMTSVKSAAEAPKQIRKLLE